VAHIVHRDCRPVQIRGAEETDEPVPQVLALHQNENRHDEDNDGGLEGAKYRLDNGPSDREHRGFCRGQLDDDGLLLRATTRKSRRIGLAPAWPDGWKGHRGGRRLAAADEPRE